VTEVDTPAGTARVELDRPDRPVLALLMLGHGAGGGVDAPDLLAVRDAALGVGLAVARVTQPYRVAGKRAPGAAPRLDAAWVAVARSLPQSWPLIVGGRSSGARVACRTAGAVGAVAVVALAFPLHPPARPERSRAAELLAAGVPVLVVNGARDPFGVPEPAPGIDVVLRPGEDHSLRKDPRAVGATVAEWLIRRGWGASS
jgi:predicted alpha/beta-hydrolase family hydrolase